MWYVRSFRMNNIGNFYEIFSIQFCQDVDQLAAEVSQLVYRLAGGVGPEPKHPDGSINTANGLPN